MVCISTFRTYISNFLCLQYVEVEMEVPEEEVVPEKEHFIAHVPVPSQKEVNILF